MKKNDQPTKRVFNLIIVDESGAFSGINETLQTVRNMQEQFPGQEQRVTLVTFDSFNTAWHYDNTPARQTKDLAWTDYSPSGGTPLYDAMGMAISKLNAQTSDADNVLVTVITDGEENSSKEWNLKMVRTMIEKLKQHNWTFTLIGTDNLDVEGMAQVSGVPSGRSGHQGHVCPRASQPQSLQCLLRVEHAMCCRLLLSRGVINIGAEIIPDGTLCAFFPCSAGYCLLRSILHWLSKSVRNMRNFWVSRK